MRLTAALSGAQDEITILNAALSEAQGEIARLNSALAEAEQRIAATNAALNALVSRLQSDLGVVFGDPTFVIAGENSLQQLRTLTAALTALERGPKLQIYRKLGGKPGR